MAPLPVAPIVGIDLGTSYSSVGVWTPSGVAVLQDETGQTAIPSMMYYQPGVQPLVGYAARPYLLTDPQNTVYSFKRLLGKKYASPEIRVALSGFPYHVVEGPGGQSMVHAAGRRMPLTTVAADLLSHLKALAEWRLNMPIADTVVTVPASADEVQRHATQTACELAHLKPRRIINEPTAAALAFGYAHVTSGVIAVYDFGGGTFDFTILEIENNLFRVLSTAGDNFLGGDDIDNALARFLSDQFWQATQIDLTKNASEWQRLLWAAEKSKRDLSFQPSTRIVLENVALRSTGPVHMDGVVTREMLEQVSREPVERTLQICQEALDAASLSIHDISAVVLVGGTTYMPLVRLAVAQFFQREPDTRMDPLTAVASGAAIQAYMLMDAAPMQPSAPLMPTAGQPVSALNSAPTPPRGLEAVALAIEDALTSMGEQSGGVAAATMLTRAAGTPQNAPAPLLLDVTPHTVGVGTGGQRFQAVIRKNTPIPAENKVRLRTWMDKQTEMLIHVYQGESPNPDQNTLIGQVTINELPPRPKGMLMVDLTLEVDSDGRIKLTARQAESGKVQVARLALEIAEECNLDL